MSMLKHAPLPFLMMITLLSITTFVGCNDDPESPDGTEVTVPKKGSTYTYTEYEVDAQGNKNDTTEQGVVATVAETGLTIGGKSDVLMFVDEYDDDETDTTYIRYESNGDMSVYLNPAEDLETVEPIWATVPFASHSAKNYTISDTVDGDTVTMTIATKWLRDEKITIGTAEMDAWVGEVTITGSFPGPFGGTITINATAELFFVPEIGYISRENSNVTSPIFSTRMVRLLTSYSLAN